MEICSYERKPSLGILGCRGCETCKLDNKRWKSPKCLQDQTQWPEQPVIDNCKESDIKKKKIKEIVATYELQKTCLISCYQNSRILKH